MFELKQTKCLKIKNITYQNLWDTYSTRIREKFITLKAYFMWLPEVGGGG